MSAKYRLVLKCYRPESRWVKAISNSSYCTYEVGIQLQLGEGLCIVSDAIGLSSKALIDSSMTSGNELFIPLYTVREYDLNIAMNIHIDMFGVLDDLGLGSRYVSMVEIMTMYLSGNSVMERIRWMER